MGSLNGKVAVVTGSTRGFGRAIAEAYAAEGAAVAVCGRDLKAAEEVAVALRATRAQAVAVRCDVGELEQVRAVAATAVRELGPIDVWVNNSAVAGPYGPTAGTPPEQFVDTIRTNIIGTYHGSLVALEQMLPRRSGTIINILGRGDKSPVPLQNAYASSKAWTRSFTRALAREYRNTGVAIHMLNPGLMDTALLRRVEVIQGYEKDISFMPTLIRMWAKHPAKPAEAAVKLASEAMRGRTGVEIRELGTGTLLAGAMGELFRRVFRREGPKIDIDVRPVAPHLPMPDQKAAR